MGSMGGQFDLCYGEYMGIRRVSDWAGGYPLAVAAVLVVAAAASPLRGQGPLSTLLFAFVPAILAVARLSGTGPSIFASVMTVAVVDVFFTRPYLQLTVSDPTEWIALVAFLSVAVVVGSQTGQIRDRERAALRRRDEMTLLNQLLFSLASEGSLKGMAKLATNRILTIVPVSRVAVYVRPLGGDVVLLSENGNSVSQRETEHVEWVLTQNKAVGLPGVQHADELRPVTVAREDGPQGVTADEVIVPLQTTRGAEGALFVQVDELDSEDVRILVAISNLFSALLERSRVEAEAAGLSAESEANRLKATLVSSVSHELKTPLAAAKAHVSGLLEASGTRDSTQATEELRAVSEELDRLNVSISDLLDLSRLESASWKPRPDAYEIGEILATVVSRLSREGRERIRFSIPADTPMAFVDFTQMVQVFMNLLQNALAYSPVDQPVTVVVTNDVGWVRIAVEDKGPGIPDSEKERVFEKFYRGSASASVPGGTGLGLAITREIVRSAGGTIVIEEPPGGGSRFVVSVPTAVLGVDDQ